MYDGETLYYMAHLFNLPSICRDGILPRNIVNTSKPEALAHSIDNKSVNSRRREVTVLGRSLHDYVPLYWATHTPMQFVVTQQPPKLPEVLLVFVVLKLSIVKLLDPIVTTDGNAAHSETSFYKDWGALSNLKKTILECENCYSPEWKRRKSAEVLVGTAIHPVFFSYIAVKSDLIRDIALEWVPTWKDRIQACPRFYYT